MQKKFNPKGGMQLDVFVIIAENAMGSPFNNIGFEFT